ncbi:MAG: hypothetical protein U1E78_11910 [Gammaproteobacteria bacterium]
MHLISEKCLLDINGGVLQAVPPVVRALETYAVVFGFPAAIITASQVYDDFGARIGENIFNATHPDPLGQMVYTMDDFPK